MANEPRGDKREPGIYRLRVARLSALTVQVSIRSNLVVAVHCTAEGIAKAFAEANLATFNDQ